MSLDASEVLTTLQVVVPSVLALLLLVSFAPSSPSQPDTHDELPGIIPVVLPITLPRVKLLVALPLALATSYITSLTYLLVTYHGHPPLISLVTASSGSLLWTAAAWRTWKAGGKRVGWAKAMGWAALVGEGWMGAIRIYLFVEATGDYPPASFPLPFFLHLILLSVRLLLLVLVLWAFYNPVRDFVPAPRRRERNGSAAGDDERQGLLSTDVSNDDNDAAKNSTVGEGDVGYGTFREAGEEQRIEGRSSVSVASQKPASLTATPLTEQPSTDELVPIAEPDAVIDLLDELDIEVTIPRTSPTTPVLPAADIPSTDIAASVPSTSPSSPRLSPMNEDGSQASSPERKHTPEPIVEATSKPSFAEVAAAATSSEPVPPPSPEPTPTSEPTPAPAAAPSAPVETPSAIAFPTLPSADLSVPSTSPSTTTSRAPSFDNSRGPTESPSVSIKEKRQRMTSLSDMGRKMSEEGRGLVRRVSQMGKSKDRADRGGSPSPSGSPSTEFVPEMVASPSGGRSSLSLPPAGEGRDAGGDGSSSTGSGSPGLVKRLSLLTRKSSNKVPSTAEARETSPVAEAAAGEEGGAANQPPQKKGSGFKKGRNGKGKKTKKK